MFHFVRLLSVGVSHSFIVRRGRWQIDRRDMLAGGWANLADRVFFLTHYTAAWMWRMRRLGLLGPRRGLDRLQLLHFRHPGFRPEVFGDAHLTVLHRLNIASTAREYPTAASKLKSLIAPLVFFFLFREHELRSTPRKH